MNINVTVQNIQVILQYRSDVTETKRGSYENRAMLQNKKEKI